MQTISSMSPQNTPIFFRGDVWGLSYVVPRIFVEPPGAFGTLWDRRKSVFVTNDENKRRTEACWRLFSWSLPQKTTEAARSRGSANAFASYRCHACKYEFEIQKKYNNRKIIHNRRPLKWPVGAIAVTLTAVTLMIKLIYFRNIYAKKMTQDLTQQRPSKNRIGAREAHGRFCWWGPFWSEILSHFFA